MPARPPRRWPLAPIAAVADRRAAAKARRTAQHQDRRDRHDAAVAARRQRAADRRPGQAPAAAGAGILRVPRRAALAAIAVLVAAASLVSFGESYRALYVWAAHHGLTGSWAVIWPLQVDVFIAVGELALFVALADCWPARSRAAAWTVTLTGLAVSVAGNVGHIAGHTLTNRITAAVPPLAAAAALAVGLGVLKRVVAAHRHQQDTHADTAPDTSPVTRADMAPVTVAAGQRTPRRTSRTGTAAAVARQRARYPGRPARDIAARLGVSERTVRRHLATQAAPAEPSSVAA